MAVKWRKKGCFDETCPYHAESLFFCSRCVKTFLVNDALVYESIKSDVYLSFTVNVVTAFDCECVRLFITPFLSLEELLQPDTQIILNDTNKKKHLAKKYKNSRTNGLISTHTSFAHLSTFIAACRLLCFVSPPLPVRHYRSSCFHVQRLQENDWP